jgi:myo-inositol-1(or 4)-monophosphatase
LTDIEFLCGLTRRAGTLALAATRSMEREFKADQSIVTNIDRAVEAMLRGELAERFPADAFYGEESGGDPKAAERVWVADPIDGTTNLAYGLPCWGVSIGLVSGGEPAMGTFYLPREGDLYWFERGAGAYCNERRLHHLDRGPLHQEDPIGIGSEAILVTDLTGFNCRQRNTGSLSAHWCYVASGALRANVSVRERLHDLAAVWGILTEAGCRVEFLEGGQATLAGFLENTLNLRPLVAGPPETIERVREVVRLRDGVTIA